MRVGFSREVGGGHCLPPFRRNMTNRLLSFRRGRYSSRDSRLRAMAGIQVGDLVLTRDEHDEDAPLEQRDVTAVFVHTVEQLRLIEIVEADGTTETIRTTDEHPFWVEGIGWVKAGELL